MADKMWLLSSFSPRYLSTISPLSLRYPFVIPPIQKWRNRGAMGVMFKTGKRRD